MVDQFHHHLRMVRGGGEAETSPPLTANGKTNRLGLPEAEYSELQTTEAFAKFNEKTRPEPRQRFEVRDGVTTIRREP